ncbi:MAG: hypothetical protein CBD59_00975 [Alphaproteobacteria bacterium TMED199]|jgi:uncharacterized protein (DUF2237 family)|nr:MAG: hypothetical protein CBD59_00975 [Alphaproteobacteria bacterium TMED199]
MDGLYKRGWNNKQLNVLGSELEACSSSQNKNGIVTGFYRDNCCNTGPDDFGLHTVCCIMTETFLTFSKSVGNDLSAPIPEYNFKGLREGDRWCLCASRWQEAFEAGNAPKVILRSTNIATISVVKLEDLKKYSV